MLKGSTQNAEISALCPFCGSGDYRIVLALPERSLRRCTSCKLASLWPRIDDDRQIDYYSEHYFGDSPKLRFDENRLRIYQHDFAVATKGTKIPGSLFDFGGGLGHFVALAGRLGWESSGVELSPRAVEFAARELHVSLVKGGLDEVQKSTGKFDVITMWNVLDHLNDPKGTLTVLRERLDKNGRLIIRVLNSPPRIALVRIGKALRMNLLASNASLFHETAFSRSTIASMLRSCGFSRVQVTNSAIAGDKKGRQISPNVLRVMDLALELVRIGSGGIVCLAPSLLIIAKV